MNEEKCLDKRVQSQQTPTHKLDKVMVKSAGRRSLPKQQKAVYAATVTTDNID